MTLEITPPYSDCAALCNRLGLSPEAAEMFIGSWSIGLTQCKQCGCAMVVSREHLFGCCSVECLIELRQTRALHSVDT